MQTAAARQPLGRLLLDRGLVNQEQIDRALLEQQKGNHQKLIGELLIELKCCTDEHVAEALAQTYGLPFARLSRKLADSRIVNSALPAEFISQNQALPLFLVERVLTVAVSEPANIFLIEEIERLSGCSVQLVVATARDIKATIQSLLGSARSSELNRLVGEDIPPDALIVETARGTEASSNTDAAWLVHHLIYAAAKAGASDIHIEPDDGMLRVRYRIDGRLVERLRPPLQMHGAIVECVRVMAGINASDRIALPQAGGVRATVDGRSIDLRLSTMPGRFGEKVVIRIVDHGKPIVNLERLGFGYDTLKQWRKLIHLPSGLILVSGPAGSGKSTTLYACLAELNRDDVNLCTIEDPVENDMVGVNQFQVDEKTGFTFAAGLRALMRQDPDVITVGEIRDSETARLATQAALTGHLVLSTIHTADAPSALLRLFNLGIEPYLVGATVCGVLAQRLVRKLCQQCKEPCPPTANQRRQIEKIIGPGGAQIDALYKPRGCERCASLGFAGRVGIHELLVPDDVLAERISNGATLKEIRELAASSGLRTLRADGIEKVQAGITTLEEIYRVTA